MAVPRFLKPGGPLTLIIIAVGVVAVLAAVMLVYIETWNDRPAESTAAAPPPAGPDDTPNEMPLELPVADAAGEPWPGSSPHALIQIPAEWNDNITAARQALRQQFDLIRQQAQVPGQDMPAVTLAMDPDVSCPVLAHALMAGRDQQVWAFNFACITAPDAREVRYLRFSLPGGGGRARLPDRPTTSRIRIRSLRAGEVAWQVDGLLLDSWDKVESLLETLSKRETAANTIVVIDPDGAVTVGQFVDVLNLLTRQGWPHVALSRPRDGT
jgi:biopolymer transport protein ExbD